MVVGGSTTSLLSLLNLIDYSKYEVDLLLYSHSGILQNKIDSRVNILSPAKLSCRKIKKFLIPDFYISLLKARYYSSKQKCILINSQYMAKYQALTIPELTKEYDIAVSFLEFWPMEMVARRVNARRKLGWIHIDIAEAGLLAGVSSDTYDKMDNIVLVSNSCKNNFLKLYPEYAAKAIVLPNLISAEVIRNLAKEEVPFEIGGDITSFMTVCRIVFASKGLDRGINVFRRLKDEKLLNNKVHWFIIGNGPDMELMKEMIATNGLTENISLLGEKSNPYAYEKKAEWFLLPSRYEGKPIAVTEAQMLGVVPVVCNYSSASEQICDSFDGIIAGNNEESLYHALKDILSEKTVRSVLYKNLSERNFSTDSHYSDYEKLLT